MHYGSENWVIHPLEDSIKVKPLSNPLLPVLLLFSHWWMCIPIFFLRLLLDAWMINSRDLWSNTAAQSASFLQSQVCQNPTCSKNYAHFLGQHDCMNAVWSQRIIWFEWDYRLIFSVSTTFCVVCQYCLAAVLKGSVLLVYYVLSSTCFKAVYWDIKELSYGLSDLFGSLLFLLDFLRDLLYWYHIPDFIAFINVFVVWCLMHSRSSFHQGKFLFEIWQSYKKWRQFILEAVKASW